MLNPNRKWLYSLVTFTQGSSYNVGGMRFVKGMPKRVTSVGIRNAIDGVDGFQIGDIYENEAVPVPVPFPVSQAEDPEDPEEETEEPEEQPAPKAKVLKKKKTVKKKVKAVKRGGE